MKRWLAGDLGGVEPRGELALLHRAVRDACDEDQDILPMVQALADLDPVACAELLVGPRALAAPRVVRAALHVAGTLESVMPPAGLYRRLIDLDAASVQAIHQRALDRHPGARWAWRLRRGEHPPGAAALAMLAATDVQGAVERALGLGLDDAVVERAVGGCRQSLRALVEGTSIDLAARAAAGLLDADPSAPVVPWIAAWWGPEPGPLLRRAARFATTDVARARLGLDRLGDE